MPEAKQKSTLSKYRFFAFPIVAGLAILIFTVFFLVPNINQTLQTRQNLTQEKERLAKLTQKTVGLRGLDETELSVKADLTLKALPAEKDIPRILATLSGWSEEVGASIVGFNVAPGKLSTVSGEIEDKEETSGLSFKLSVAGTTEAITNLLDRLASTIPVLTIGAVSLSETEGKMSADITLEVYFLPLPETLGLTEKPIAKITAEEEIAYRKIERFQTPLTEKFLPLVSSGKEDLFSF